MLDFLFNLVNFDVVKGFLRENEYYIRILNVLKANQSGNE